MSKARLQNQPTGETEVRGAMRTTTSPRTYFVSTVDLIISVSQTVTTVSSLGVGSDVD